MISVTTHDNITHYIGSAEAIATYSSSPATVAAIQAAYDAGDWAPYTPPESEPPEQAPNWSEFRLALMVNPGFREWGLALPADWREDLKMAALAANLEALQSVYTHLASIYPPEPAATVEWQQIATDAHIPVTFRNA